MALDLYFSGALKRLRATQVVTEAGAGAKIAIYTGSIPTNAEAALSSNTKVAEFTGNATTFGVVSGTGNTAVLTLNALTDANNQTTAIAAGTVTFFRIFKANGTTVVAQGTVGTSSADLILNKVAFDLGDLVQLNTGGTITEA